MRKIIKVVVIILVLAIAALAAIPFVVDPNDYKDEIATQVEKATGRQLTIQGDIGLSVFPWIALELGQLSLSNANGFKAESFAQVNNAQIRIKLLPLLKKELEMDTVILDGLVLNLETNKNGSTNWEDLSNPSTETEAEIKEAAPESAQDAPPALAAISIAGVRLTNANILWSDDSKGENYQLRNLNLETDPLVPGEPTALSMNFDLISAKPEAKAHVTLDTSVMVDVENQHYALEGLKFTTLAEGTELPIDKANITLNADVAADMVKQVVTLKGLKVDTIASKDDQELTATLNGQVDANLANQQYNVTDFALNGTVAAAALPGGKADLELTTDISANLAQQTLSLADLSLKLQDLMLNGKIDASKILAETPAFAGNIQIKPFNLRKLANDMNVELPEMADNSTLETVSLQAQIEGTNNRVNAKDLQVTLDQSQLTGQFAVENFAKPGFRFNLNLDEIDADRYLPPVKEKTEQPKAPPAAAAAGGASELPLDTLRDINAKGSLKIGKLKASGITSENIVVTIDAQDGLIKLNPMQADLYQGKYRGNVTVDARGDALKLAIDEKLEGVQAGPLLDDLTGESKISGKADGSIKLTGTGKDIDGIKQTLSGNGQFAFSDGAIKGINIAQTIRKAKAALSGQKLADGNEPEATDFSSLSGSFTADKGVINNQDLAMMSPLLRVNGNGTASLPKETIDYNLRVSIVGTSKGQGGKELEELKGISIPLKITGTFSEPKPSVDLAAILKEQATDELKGKAEEKLKEKLGDDLGGLLGGALGGKKATEAPAATDSESTADETTSEPAPEEQPSAEDQLKEDVKNKLKSFF
ncbi:AsmA family protein [Methylophaga sp. OBS3]|uniref:AsmA family protein n=1 Tax=Methylophaga sp. OBS3 TaxID=2991934 RepID=UPI00225B4153|nr:AsmA family protein [Methylophaga sp. OBS3]MCX4190305.1 AsmA family protein [Methylophaga sp. OBS3]